MRGVRNRKCRAEEARWAPTELWRNSNEAALWSRGRAGDQPARPRSNKLTRGDAPSMRGRRPTQPRRRSCAWRSGHTDEEVRRVICSGALDAHGRGRQGRRTRQRRRAPSVRAAAAKAWPLGRMARPRRQAPVCGAAAIAAAKLRRRAEPHLAEKPQLCGSLWAHGGAGAKPAQSWSAGARRCCSHAWTTRLRQRRCARCRSGRRDVMRRVICRAARSRQEALVR